MMRRLEMSSKAPHNHIKMKHRIQEFSYLDYFLAPLT